MSQDIVKIWIAKFGEPPASCQIRKGFPPLKIRAIAIYNMLIMDQPIFIYYAMLQYTQSFDLLCSTLHTVT